jgi:hypothetical protein
VAQMIRRVLPDDIQDGSVGSACVMQICDTISEPWAEVEESPGRSPGYACIAIGGSGGNALEQGEHRPHSGRFVQSCDQVDLRCARVREAGINAPSEEGLNEGFCSRHPLVSVGWARSV